MHIPLQGNLAQDNDARIAVIRDKMGAGRSGQKLTDQIGPGRSRN